MDTNCFLFTARGAFANRMSLRIVSIVLLVVAVELIAFLLRLFGVCSLWFFFFFFRRVIGEKTERA